MMSTPHMVRRIIYGAFVLIIGCVFLVPIAYANPHQNIDDGGTGSGTNGYVLLEPSILVQGGGKSASPADYLENIFYFMIGTAGVLAVLVFAIGGIQFMVSGATPSAKKEGQEKMTAAIFGLILALGTWLILNTINPDLVKKFDLKLDTVTVTGSGGTGSGTSTPGNLPSNLPIGCSNYKNAFINAANTAKIDACLLYAVASQESGCNPGLVSKAGACGIMQMLPSTANASCNWLKTNPEASILRAAFYLKSNANGLHAYDSMFDIGNAYGQSGKTVQVGGFIYDTGNDDLIASYNAGNGTVSTNGRGPFSLSQDCPKSTYGTNIPAWQCHINPGGFDETQNYVRRVQSYQDMCNLKGL